MSAKKTLTGVLLNALSALAFALAAVFAKYAVTASVPVHAVFTTFFRFLIGTIAAAAWLFFKKESFRPNNVSNVVWRSVFNTLAVTLWFVGVQYTTVTKSNFFNSMAAAFIFIFAPFINKERSSWHNGLFLLLMLAGAALMLVAPSDVTHFFAINVGDGMAIISAVLAALALCYLREARKSDSTFIILFYMMGTGLVLNAFLLIFFWQTPNGYSLLMAVLSGAMGVVGQILLTESYVFINATVGGLVSSSKVIFAAVFGICLFGDPITLPIVLGAALIVIALIGISGVFERPRTKNRTHDA